MQDTNQLDQSARKLAKNYMGDFAWPTVLLGCFVFVGYFGTPILVASGLMSLWVALPVMTVLTYAAYTVMHESVHGSINGSHASLRWVNELMGYLAAQVFMVPLTAHRHEHLAHHRNTNNPEEDPDYRVAQMDKSPAHAVLVTATLLASNYSYYLKHRWSTAPGSQNIRFCLEATTAVGLRVAFVAQGYWLEGLVLFVIAGIAGSLLLAFLFAYLPHRPYTDTGRYLDTATIIVPGVLGGWVTALWGFQNYHAIHHLFPRVPFYKYQCLFGDIEETMIASGAPIYRLSLKGLAQTIDKPVMV